MRIIAGSFKGRRLRAPDWPGLRPTSDRLRETLFNVLGDRVLGATVLDACAGSGALGIESISRGARTATFIECDGRAAALIVDNAERCGISDRCVVVHGTLPEAMTRDGLQDRFDLILLDPPYDDPKIDAILSSVAERLAISGLLVLERTRLTDTHDAPGITHIRCVKSGDSALDFYIKKEESSGSI